LRFGPPLRHQARLDDIGSFKSDIGIIAKIDNWANHVDNAIAGQRVIRCKDLQAKTMH